MKRFKTLGPETEEVMLRGNRIIKSITLILLILVLGMSAIHARVVASETLKIYAYIPERTMVSFSETGELLFNSNVPSAQLGISYLSDTTLLSVIAR